MIPWLNFGVLIASSFLFTLFYVKSVSPAALEKRIGHSAYQRCATSRMISSVFMIIVAVNYILYHWFPLPLPLPRTFSWPWWVLAFLVHSPFLVFFSFAYVPVWYYLCVAEERDLLIRYGAAYEAYRAKTGFWLPKSRNKDNAT